MDNAVVVGGLGMVGTATRHAFGIENFIDLKESNISYKKAGSMRYIFICVPTPTINGDCYTEDVKKVIAAISDHSSGQNIFIIRSTVKPGTTRGLIDHFGFDWIVHNPEFLTESTWKEDAEHPDLAVVGGENMTFVKDVEAIYKARYKGLDVIKTDSITSETIKYAINGFYSTKVVYANQLYDFCEKSGSNYEKIKEAMYKRKWIGKNHLDVWHNGGRGAGGKCLAKDLESFANQSNSPLLKQVDKLNKEYLSKDVKKT